MKHLEIQDLPRDHLQALSLVRKPLVLTFNYCRSYPEKMKLFKATLQAVLKKITEWEKANKAPVKKKETE